MAIKPWMTSNSLIAAVKRKMAVPIYQTTFTENDILAFANEEMMISQVPNVLEYHQEYFVFEHRVELQPNTSRYAIPNRAVGMRLRDIAFVDQNGNYFEMTRVNSEDKSFFQRNIANSTNVHKFYVEGNDIVLTPSITQLPVVGSLAFFIYLRPNQLVKDELAATIGSFRKELDVVNNSQISLGVTNFVIGNYGFTPVASSPQSFQYIKGVDETATATNIATSINASPLYPTIQANVINNTSVQIQSFDHPVQITYTTNLGVSTDNLQELVCTSAIPSNITANIKIDLLQTEPGHRTYKYDVLIPPNGVSGSSIFLLDSDVSSRMVVGDYVCNQNECIIPQIPPDLHNGLAERVCARIMQAMGDFEGKGITDQKIADIREQEGTLLDNRTEGAPQKINGRHSMLRQLGVGSRRRL